MAAHLKGSEHRTPDHPIEPIFLDRWSPRAMSGEPLDEGELMRLFEAARWAPSTYNEQEWRFLYARRDSPHWPAFFGLLVEANQAWCGKAAVLMVVLSHKVFARDGRPNPVHTFDAEAGLREPGGTGRHDGPGRPRHGGLRPEQGAGDAPGSRRLRGRGDGRGRPPGRPGRAAAPAPGDRGALRPQARGRARPRGDVRVLERFMVGLRTRPGQIGSPLIRPSGTFSPPGRRGRWTPAPSGRRTAEGESGRPRPDNVGERGLRACASQP